MTNQLEALKKHSLVVADSGDIEAVARWKPQDATTNPSLLLASCEDPRFRHLIDRDVDQVFVNFGREILNPDGSINRPKLAELAFGSPDLPQDQRGSRVAELNRIVHPAVIRSQEDWMQAVGVQDRHAVAIVEAALILEAGMGKRFDRLIVVTCAPEQRVARFAARQKIDVESATREVQRRMAAQLSDEEKVEAADYVIDNSGSLATTSEQVTEIWKKLQSEARSTTS